SKAEAMSIALRRPVPLNSRCSRKCVDPWWPLASSRDPTPTQHPKVTERSPGIASVSTRTPPGRTLRRTRAPPDSPAIVCAAAADPAGVSGSGTAGLPLPTSGVGAGRLGGIGPRCRIGSAVAGRSLVQDRHERELPALIDLG